MKFTHSVTITINYYVIVPFYILKGYSSIVSSSIFIRSAPLTPPVKSIPKFISHFWPQRVLGKKKKKNTYLVINKEKSGMRSRKIMTYRAVAWMKRNSCWHNILTRRMENLTCTHIYIFDFQYRVQNSVNAVKLASAGVRIGREATRTEKKDVILLTIASRKTKNLNIDFNIFARERESVDHRNGARLIRYRYTPYPWTMIRRGSPLFFRRLY